MSVHSLGKRIPWHNKQLSPAIAFSATCVCAREREIIHQFIIFCQPPSPPRPLQKPIYQKSRGRWRRDETAPVVFTWGIFHWCLLELGILDGIWIALPKFAALNEAAGGLPGPGGRQTGTTLFLCLSYSLLSQQNMVPLQTNCLFFLCTEKKTYRTPAGQYIKLC